MPAAERRIQLLERKLLRYKKALPEAAPLMILLKNE